MDCFTNMEKLQIASPSKDYFFDEPFKQPEVMKVSKSKRAPLNCCQSKSTTVHFTSILKTKVGQIRNSSDPPISSTNATNMNADNVPLDPILPCRSLRFADEEGQPMETVHQTPLLSSSFYPPGLTRTIVLLLDPKRKLFEFVHVFINMEEHNPMSDVLRHLRKQATDKALKKQKYTGIARPFHGGEELINTFSIQDQHLDKDEFTVAIPRGYTRAETLEMAAPLLNSRKVTRRMRRIKKSHKLDAYPTKTDKKTITKNIYMTTTLDRTPIHIHADDKIPLMSSNEPTDTSTVNTVSTSESYVQYENTDTSRRPEKATTKTGLPRFSSARIYLCPLRATSTCSSSTK